MNEQPFIGSFFHAIIKIGKKVIITLFPTFCIVSQFEIDSNKQIFGTTECFTVAFVSVKKRPKKYLQRPKKGIEDLCIGATEEKKLQKQSERKKALPENVYCNFFL